MSKSELAGLVATKTGMSKIESEAAVTAIIEGITSTLAKGGKVQLVGFGTFEVRQRQAREGRNPSTGEAIKIAAQRMPAFKAGKR